MPSFALAQADSVPKPPSDLCWRGKPASRCRSFWITEMSGEYAYATTSTHYTFSYGTDVRSYSRRDVSPQLLWTIGPMFNRSPTRAIGGTVSAGFVNDGSRFAIEARQRQWTTEGSAI